MTETLTDEQVEEILAGWQAEKACSREWQDISTAPKDGTRIITESRGLVGTSRWSERFADAYGDGDTSPGWYSETLDRRHEPTHWMPLPTPKEPTS